MLMKNTAYEVTNPAGFSRRHRQYIKSRADIYVKANEAPPFSIEKQFQNVRVSPSPSAPQNPAHSYDQSFSSYSFYRESPEPEQVNFLNLNGRTSFSAGMPCSPVLRPRTMLSRKKAEDLDDLELGPLSAYEGGNVVTQSPQKNFEVEGRRQPVRISPPYLPTYGRNAAESSPSDLSPPGNTGGREGFNRFSGSPELTFALQQIRSHIGNMPADIDDIPELTLELSDNEE